MSTFFYTLTYSCCSPDCYSAASSCKWCYMLDTQGSPSHRHLGLFYKLIYIPYGFQVLSVFCSGIVWIFVSPILVLTSFLCYFGAVTHKYLICASVVCISLFLLTLKFFKSLYSLLNTLLGSLWSALEIKRGNLLIKILCCLQIFLYCYFTLLFQFKNHATKFCWRIISCLLSINLFSY